MTDSRETTSESRGRCEGNEKDPGTNPTKATEVIQAVAASLTAITVIVAGGKLLFGWLSPISLEVDLPPAIEFRCSNPSFDSEACLGEAHESHSADFHVTVTAALNVKAIGDPMKEAAIERAIVDLYFPTDAGSKVGGPFRLTGLWAADFVPGQPFHRRQLSVSSLKGGQSQSQELWFFPMAVPCGDTPIKDCRSVERRNFLTWSDFVTHIESIESDLPARESITLLDFNFAFRDGGQNDEHDDTKSSERISCVVELAETARRMTENPKRALHVTSPCHELCKQNQNLADLPAVDLRYRGVDC